MPFFFRLFTVWREGLQGSKMRNYNTKMFVISCMVMVLLLSKWCDGVRAQPSPRALFVFGDSLVDSGNNNFIATIARADNKPYGIDYPTRQPTGRYSNGLHIPDFISESLGAEPVLPYLNPTIHTANNLLRGANFASAGVGILNDSGLDFGPSILRMPLQLELFRDYQNKVAAIIGRSATDRLVGEGLVSITVGTNDFINNYYLTPISTRSLQYDLPDYTRFVVCEYRKILKRLYELGARRIMVTGMPPFGCIPFQRATRTIDGECDPTLQRATALMDAGILTMVHQLNREYGANVYTFANLSVNMDIISDPTAHGFETAQIACCGQGRFNGIGLCNPASHVCANRDSYVFWDFAHPSERACQIIVSRFMSGVVSAMNPVNLNTMLQLHF